MSLVKRLARTRAFITGESYSIARMRVKESDGKYERSKEPDSRLRELEDAKATIIYSPPRKGQ